MKNSTGRETRMSVSGNVKIHWHYVAICLASYQFVFDTVTYGYLLPSGVSYTELQVKSLLRSCCCFSVDKKQLWISVFFIAILGFFCYRRSLKDLDTKVSNWHWLSLIIINWLLTEHTWTDWRHRQKTGGPSNQCSAPTMQIWKMKNPPTLTQQYYISYDFSSDIYCFISTHIKWILLHI